MTKHIGYGGNHHDSASEAKASFKLADLGFLHSGNALPMSFTDPDGLPFNAKDDFYHARYGIHLEWKDGILNGVKSKASSEKQLADKRSYRGGFNILKDNLDLGWNHARRKQAIVQTAMTSEKLIVCFRKPPTFKEALTYWCAGIVFCTLASLPSHLASIRLKQAGLAASFHLNYITEEEGLTVFTTGPYIGDAVRVVVSSN